MSAASRLPTNKNFLSPLGFVFNIYKTPGVNYFVQSASIPTVNLGVAEVATPFNRLKFPGDKVSFGTFDITFRVDENLVNYMELYNWITKIGLQKGFAGYKDVSDASVGLGIYSDASLTVLSSSKNPIANVKFTNMFPTDLSELVFDARLSDVDYIDVIATFAYQAFTIEHLV